MKRFKSSDIIAIRRNLLNWFEISQRDLPWRRTYNPYHVWISEIMLQQTQVKTMVPYFERWMTTLPTITSVAEADEQVLLKLWEGLGYYSRVRNIQKAARMIVNEFNGQFPSNHSDILHLPGVGKYTAGAIASIAFNQVYPVVDVNVIRVIARLLNFDGNTKESKNIERMWKRAGELLPSDSRNFNQAMMELGALICKPKNPSCSFCPVQKFCSSFKAGTMNDLPHRGEKKKITSLQIAVAVIRKDNKVFIQKRPSRGLMGGLWEFPGGKIEKGESAKKALSREIQEELSVTIKNIHPIIKIKHAYTCFKVDLHCFSADYDAGSIKLNSATQGKWVEFEKLSEYPFPAANVRLIQQLQ
ncbi:A/G-specific adenine glycosylase [Candidatus Peregrinibacteria bacterium CG_4_10_14_0_2_um_filter_43_11]|nr:MAG: A/G-specific adenine glycosylase [Candidatus Peregrinibacteria bacterium CG_4_10_14_0_2_um_filter_43_11]